MQAPPSPYQQVRFCTEPYSPPASDNLDHVYAHLTNYAVNKHNAAFQFNQCAACPREGSDAVAACCAAQGGLHQGVLSCTAAQGGTDSPLPTSLVQAHLRLLPLVSARHPRPSRDAAEAGAGSKWTLTAFAEWMGRQGHDFEALWRQVGGCSCGLGRCFSCSGHARCFTGAPYA